MLCFLSIGDHRERCLLTLRHRAGADVRRHAAAERVLLVVAGVHLNLVAGEVAQVGDDGGLLGVGLDVDRDPCDFKGVLVLRHACAVRRAWGGGEEGECPVGNAHRRAALSRASKTKASFKSRKVNNKEKMLHELKIWKHRISQERSQGAVAGDTTIQHYRRGCHVVLLDLKDFIVEVVLEGFAVVRVLFLLLELLLGFGAVAAAFPLAPLLRLVPLLLLMTVYLSGDPRRQLHSW